MEHISLIFLTLIGFSISFYVWRTKSKNKRLVCYLDNTCNEVVNSKYGKHFGVDNTIWGMLYYIAIFSVSFYQLIRPEFFQLGVVIVVSWAKFILAGASAIFSVYLLFVQWRILKKWCEYCIVSALISFIIFLVIIS